MPPVRGAFSLLVSGDFNVTCLMDAEKLKTFCAFSLLVSGDFNVTWSSSPVNPVMSQAFSLLVSGDFNVTEDAGFEIRDCIQLSVS